MSDEVWIIVCEQPEQPAKRYIDSVWDDDAPALRHLAMLREEHGPGWDMTCWQVRSEPPQEPDDIFDPRMGDG